MGASLTHWEAATERNFPAHADSNGYESKTDMHISHELPFIRRKVVVPAAASLIQLEWAIFHYPTKIG